jgi:hypothetical protein
MKKHLRAILAALACFGGLAAGQDVRYNFDPNVDFSKFKTYERVIIKNASIADELLDKQIINAIDAQMAVKNFQKRDDKGDVYVGYQFALNQEKQLDSYSTGWGWGWGGTTTMTTSTIHVGTLVIDVYDPATKHLIWRATGTKTLKPSKNPQKNQEKLQKAVAKIMKNFPPPKKKG